MRTWIRKTALTAGAAAAAFILVFAEPMVRPQREAAADAWQLHYGSQYDYCESCCTLSFCCQLGDRCRRIVT